MKRSTIATVVLIVGVVALAAGCSSTPTVAPSPIAVDSSPAPSSSAAPSPASSALSVVTVTTQPPAPVTVTAAAPPAPVTVTEQAPVYVAPPPVVVSSGIFGLPSGLLCRDLLNDGYSDSQLWQYWNYWNHPSQMDADSNGIPCETVVPGGVWPWGAGQ